MFCIAIISGVLIFSSKNITDKLGLTSIVNDYRKWISLIFIASITIFAVNSVIFGYNKCKLANNLRKVKQNGIKRLNNLTYEEKIILQYFVCNQTRTQKLNYRNGIVQELEYFKIIYRSSNIVNSEFNRNSYELELVAPYNIQPWVFDYLSEYPELLGIPFESSK